MTTDILREVAKYSLGLVYNLVASLEIILQSSASPRVGQRPTAFTSGHQENQVLTPKNCGLASKISSFGNGFYKSCAAGIKSHRHSLCSLETKSFGLTLLQWRPIPIRKLSGLMSLCIKFFVCTYSILLIICKKNQQHVRFQREQDISLNLQWKHDFFSVTFLCNFILCIWLMKTIFLKCCLNIFFSMLKLHNLGQELAD